MFDKPVIEVTLSSSDCGLIVVVNGCQLMRDNTGDPVDVVQAINPFVRSGDNELEALLLLDPPDQPNVARLQLELKIRDLRAEPGSGILLTRIAYDGRLAGAGKATTGSTPAWNLVSTDGFRRDAHGDVRVGELEAKVLPPPFTNQSPALRRTVSMPLPLPPWAFFTGDFLPEGWGQVAPVQGLERQLYESLLAAYRELWTALARKDMAALQASFDERSREYDQALFLPPGTTWGICSRRIQQMWDDPNGRLASVEDDGEPWLIEARVPRTRTTFLSFGPYASPILRFVTDDNPERSYADVLPVWFRRQGNRFIPTR